MLLTQPVGHWKPCNVAQWCCGYHYCATSFNKAWTQVLRMFKFCSWHVGDSQWWGSMTMVPAGNKAKRLSLVNHTLKTIYHLHHHHYQSGWVPKPSHAPDFFRLDSEGNSLGHSPQGIEPKYARFVKRVVRTIIQI